MTDLQNYFTIFLEFRFLSFLFIGMPMAFIVLYLEKQRKLKFIKFLSKWK